MIIIAVLIGYVLGVAPFLFFYIQNSKSDTKQDGYLKSDNLTTYIDEDTVNEWLYGPKKEEKVSEVQKVPIYDEILTGEESRGNQ